MENSSKKVVVGAFPPFLILLFRRSLQTRAEYSSCTFVNSSSSVVALAGAEPSIEVIDLRGVSAGFKISDLKAPFSSVSCMTAHQSDPHLLAISCRIEGNGSETRVYDIRYPKESSLNIYVSEPHSMLQFGNFSSSSNLKGTCVMINDASVYFLCRRHVGHG